MLKILFLSAMSITVEIDNSAIYFNERKDDIFLDEQLIFKDYDKNIFSIFDLIPDKDYSLTYGEDKITFHTLSCSEIVYSKGIDNTGMSDVTEKLQMLINNSKDNSLIVIEEGIYHITSLFLKSNKTVYLKKGAVLSASIKENDYLDLPSEIVDENGNEICLSTWEGSPQVMKTSIINGFNIKNAYLIGEGEINGNAQLSTWWVDFRKKPYARPHIIYINNSENIVIQGIKVKNSPQWTIHPFFSKNLKFLDLYIENPKVSPNTDGLNPQACDNVEIIGVYFSVGDDCIALKSGKIDLARKYKKPCTNITIRNCYMKNGHGAIVLGSEMSGGIKNITVSRCIFEGTDRGLRIKTRRGRGKDAIIDGVVFSDILMKNVLTPLVINMFYFCDPDGKTEYVYSKEKLPIDDRTPYLGAFTFRNLRCEDSEVCAGYFYGLPEQPIEKIEIDDCYFSFKEDAQEGTPAMMSFAETLTKSGFKFYNVNKVILNNNQIIGNIGDKMFVNNVKEFYVDEL